MANNLLRNIPSLAELLEKPQLKTMVDRVSHNVVVTRARQYLDDLRTQVQNATSDIVLPSASELAERIAQRILQGDEPRLRPVINASGIVLRGDLGRPPLASEAIEDLVGAARDYVSVEIDLESGQPADRASAVQQMLCELTGAEAAVVVNNNAAATLLTLAALAQGREVVVSRGQLVDVEGDYQLPEIINASGAVLREVGTTNQTREEGYLQAIGTQTAALMRVHTSGFAVVGSVSAVSLPELVELGRQRRLPVIDDLGGGALIDFGPFGLAGQPMAAASVRAGADLVLFSGDKLLGGPQCGIIVGRRERVDRISQHPMMRALRADKLTLAALGATLRLYRDPEKATREVPLLQLLATNVENLKNRAERLAPQIAACGAVETAEAVADAAYLGHGSLSTEQMPSWCISVKPAAGWSLDRLAKQLRTGHPSVIGCVRNDQLHLNLRTVFPRQDALLTAAFDRLSPKPTTGEPA